MKFLVTVAAAAIGVVMFVTVAQAAKCSSTGAAFESWKKAFAAEAKSNGAGPRAISALKGTKYSTGTIRADRNQKSFKLSLDAFMAKRGAAESWRAGAS